MSRTATTIFPEPIGMSATFDTALIHQEGDIIATEARALHNDYIQKHDGDSWQQTGLTYYSPNINIVRDPRWGRGQETYGEDPFLTGRMGVAFITGLQGNDPRYIKIIACAKHYAVHNGPESQRHTMNMEPSQRDLYETYLPQFEAAVRGHIYRFGHGRFTVRCTEYQTVPAHFCSRMFCALHGVLMGSLFQTAARSPISGQTINTFPQRNRQQSLPSKVDAMSPRVTPASTVKNENAPKTGPRIKKVGCGGDAFAPLTQAVQDGLISQEDIDRALAAELTARFRVGIFDPPAMVPYSTITMADDDTPANHDLSEKVAEESITYF